MLTLGTPRRTYNVAAPQQLVIDGAQRQGTDGRGNDYTWAIARPSNSPAPIGGPHYLTNVPTAPQHNRIALSGGAPELSLRPNPAVGVSP